MFLIRDVKLQIHQPQKVVEKKDEKKSHKEEEEKSSKTSMEAKTNFLEHRNKFH